MKKVIASVQSASWDPNEDEMGVSLVSWDAERTKAEASETTIIFHICHHWKEGEMNGHKQGQLESFSVY
jgi:hypothetical protein